MPIQHWLYPLGASYFPFVSPNASHKALEFRPRSEFYRNSSMQSETPFFKYRKLMAIDESSCGTKKLPKRFPKLKGDISIDLSQITS